MMDANQLTCIRPLSDDGTVSARIARTEHVRVEFLSCRPESMVQWRTERPDLSLMWVRDKGKSPTRITFTDAQSLDIPAGRANFWFFPEGIDSHGEVTGKGTFDCAAVTVDPAFLAPSARMALTTPIAGFSHQALGRAFDDLMTELEVRDDILPLFTDGWAMQALAHVARAARSPDRSRPGPGSGLAPWQLRRAKGMLSQDLANQSPLADVARACRLSVSHFSRAFKISTGVPPHRWLTAERVELAKKLLASTGTPLVDVACICGFADQSHFSRVFVQHTGSTPRTWRRGNQVGPLLGGSRANNTNPGLSNRSLSTVLAEGIGTMGL
jgi:AraC-like DNA-binding protein